MEKKENFISIVKAVIENNRINDGQWTDWTNSKHMQEVYGQLEDEYKETAELFLNTLIRTEGNYKKELVSSWWIINYGVELSNDGID